MVIENDSLKNNVFNVGSGEKITVNEIADLLNKATGSNNKAQTTNEYRVGDIRHCFADISSIQNKTDYKPRKFLKNNINEFVSIVNEYLKNPQLDSENRKRIVKEQCYKIDGNSSKRIANRIINLMDY